MSLTEFYAEEVIRDFREEGREEGRSEKAIETAKNLLKENISSEIIARSTGLSLEKMLDLQKELAVNK
ncbi:MAG: hypothetical protein IJ688_14455 [Treponema sp.]|nr:hypothetical protein [Treponema sp.]